MAWLSGWSYRKEITVTGQSGAGTNYQVDLDIGDSAGGDFHLEGHCTNFPQDIEVTDNDGTTLLKFWIADLTADPLRMLIKVADDLGSNQTIYVYYGKSGATTNSSGADTFVQYHGVASSDFLDSAIVQYSNVVFESKVKTTSTPSNILIGLENVANVADDAIWVQSVSSNDLRYAGSGNEGTYTQVSEAPLLTVDTYYKAKITNDGTTVRGYFDDNEVSTGITADLPNENLGLFLWISQGTGEQEYSFARKYNSPEPAFSSAGSEETPPTGVTMPLFIHHHNQMRA